MPASLGIPKNKPTTIDCPNCKELGKGSVKLIVKANSHNGNLFLGCPNYPYCNHTQPISEEIRMRLQGQQELF